MTSRRTGPDARAWSIFDEVIDLPAAVRAARLADRCAGDDALRGQVEALLQADATDAELFRGGDAVRWSEALARDAGADATMPERSIGAWKIVGVIGYGGMGAVHAVERGDGAYAQRAALKLIRAGADSPAARERFLRERQILAGLRHPYIATLLDGGISAEGELYFVMERVDGMPLDRWCDERKLGLRERVSLFLQVLEAVGYAHRNLVVHRDLKPSNLLVDGEGRIKLLDFGIARQLESAEFTMTADRALTFEYASPEQLHDAPITTATDLWQLGIVLHRLLSGAHPFGLDRDTPLAKQLQRLEREPEPLTRAGAQASAEQAALRGGLAPPALAKALRGNLDAIVSTCLRREPDARYASADALAGDLRRWLDDRPILAAIPTRRERARLWLRRHRALAAALAAVSVALLAGAGIALWQAGAAREQARIAQRESESARATLAFLTDTLAAAAPDQAMRTEVGVRELLDKAHAQLDRQTMDPQARQSVQRMLGSLYLSLGDGRTAAALYEDGFRNVTPRSREELEALAPQLNGFAAALDHVGQGRRNLELAHLGARWWQALAPDDPVGQLRTAVLLGSGYYDAGQFDAATAEWQRAIALAKRIPQPPVDIVLEAHHMLAGTLTFQGKHADSLATTEEALAFADRNAIPPAAPIRVNLLRSRAEALDGNGDPAAAEAVIRQAIAIQEQAVGDTGMRMGSLYNTLGSALTNLGRYREALQALEHAQSLGLGSGDSPKEQAIGLANLASVHENAGDYPRALTLFEQSVMLLDKARLAADDPVRRTLQRNHARCLGLAGRHADADALLRALQAKALALDGEDSLEYAMSTWQRAAIAGRAGDARNGRPQLDRAKSLWAGLVPETHPIFAHALRTRAKFSLLEGDPVGAESDQREAYARLRQGALPVDVAITQAELAAIRDRQGDAEEARELLRESLPVLRTALLPQEINRAAAEALARKLGLPSGQAG